MTKYNNEKIEKRSSQYAFPITVASQIPSAIAQYGLRQIDKALDRFVFGENMFKDLDARLRSLDHAVDTSFIPIN